jgi:hypothetical protein
MLQSRRLRLPRHGTIVAYAALFVALGGTAYAANTVGSKDIIDNSVQSKDIKDQTITATDIAGADFTGLISFSAGSVANGRCIQTSLAVAGAKTGESAIVTPLGAVQTGIVFQAQRVSSDDHVVMNLCNLSGATMSAINGLQIRVVTFG